MIIGAALLLAALPAAPLPAQIQLSVISAGGERAVGAQYNIGSVGAGESADTRFRIRNAASIFQDIQRISVAGTGFSIADRPPLPYRLASGASVDFVVRFLSSGPGGYSAALTVNTTDVLLTASAAAQARLTLVQSDGSLRALSAGDDIDFGRVERGSPATRRLALQNDYATAVAVSRLSISGGPFRFVQAPAPPLTVAARTAMPFEIEFAPDTAGGFSGTLDIDQRSYRLSGTAVNPPYPRPLIVIEPESFTSAAQGRVFVRFQPPARIAGKGTLAIELRAGPAGPADPAVLFASGSRSAEFTFSEGDAEAAFAGASGIAFQTGSTAGTLLFTASLGEYREQAGVEIQPAAAGIQTVRAARNSFSVTVDVAGFDNTRSASQVVFTFTAANGAVLPVRYDASADFKRYFESSEAGGAFLLHAVFPVSGNSSEIGSVQVEMVNSAGTCRPAQAAIP